MEEGLQEGQEEREFRPYKIMPNDCVYVRRNDVVSSDGVPYTFYYINIPVKKKGKAIQFKKEIQFKEEVSLLDNTKIRLINFSEKVRMDKQMKYYPVWGLFINEFEVIDEPNYYEMQNDIEDYQGANEDPFY